jgi:hypothetical protein
MMGVGQKLEQFGFFSVLCGVRAPRLSIALGARFLVPILLTGDVAESVAATFWDSHV